MSTKNRTARTAIAVAATLVPIAAAVFGANAASATTASTTTAHHRQVTVRAGALTHTATCPTTESASARIRSQGPATVHFHWLRSDGAESPQHTHRFRGAGRHSYSVHYDWTLGGDSSAWLRLVVTGPDHVATRQLHFWTYCATQVWVGDASATDARALCEDIYTVLGGDIALWGDLPPGVRYYWTVDGSVVGDSTVTDPAELASGSLTPTYYYDFVPPSGTTYHSAVLHAEATDGSSSWDSPPTYFTTTCV